MELHTSSVGLTECVAKLGYLASRPQLAAAGFGRHAVDSALRQGKLLRVRPGWVATEEANQLAVIAILNGARVTAATALRSYGVWASDDHRLHLQVPPNAHRVPQETATPITRFRPPRFAAEEVVTHWAPAAQSPIGSPAWRVPLTDALIRFASMESDEQLAAAIESSVHEKRMSRSAVPALIRRLPRRQRRLGARLNYLSGSGLETVARLRLQLLGYHVVPQVQIGRDRVDLVVDGWLIIELDGDEWHDPIADRIRTNRLIRSGYRVLRFGYAEIFGGWADALATIREMLGERVS
jgi:very-short-patch-repair endonuclease